MPELPEVETVKNGLKTKVLNKKITDCKVIYQGIIAYPNKERFIKEISNQSNVASPEKILSTIKSTLGQTGETIRGSWIMMKPEKYTKNELDYDVYKGGLTKQEGTESTQYEFIADATTGTIIDFYEQVH